MFIDVNLCLHEDGEEPPCGDLETCKNIHAFIHKYKNIQMFKCIKICGHMNAGIYNYMTV